MPRVEFRCQRCVHHALHTLFDVLPDRALAPAVGGQEMAEALTQDVLKILVRGRIHPPLLLRHCTLTTNIQNTPNGIRTQRTLSGCTASLIQHTSHSGASSSLPRTPPCSRQGGATTRWPLGAAAQPSTHSYTYLLHLRHLICAAGPHTGLRITPRPECQLCAVPLATALQGTRLPESIQQPDPSVRRPAGRPGRSCARRPRCACCG